MANAATYVCQHCKKELVKDPYANIPHVCVKEDAQTPLLTHIDVKISADDKDWDVCSTEFNSVEEFKAAVLESIDFTINGY